MRKILRLAKYSVPQESAENKYVTIGPARYCRKLRYTAPVNEIKLGQHQR